MSDTPKRVYRAAGGALLIARREDELPTEVLEVGSRGYLLFVSRAEPLPDKLQDHAAALLARHQRRG